MNTVHANHLHDLDRNTPDEIYDKQEGEYTIRMQRHGDLYHVCTMNREGQRVGSWLTTTNLDLAEYQVEYLGLNAMMGKE